MTLNELVVWAVENHVPFDVPVMVENIYSGYVPVTDPVYSELHNEVLL